MGTDGFIPQGHLSTTVSDVYREGFYSALNSNLWTTVTGSGQTVTSSGGNLTIVMGTTANAESSVTTVNYWRVPVRCVVGLAVSQKIANNEIRVELVSANDNTIVAAWAINGSDSTTTTQAVYEIQNAGPSRLRSGNVTVGAVTSTQLYEMEIGEEETWFHQKPADTVTGRAFSFVRNSVSPEPNKSFKLRVRCTNGATAPASSTTVTVSFTLIQDYQELSAEIVGGRGGVTAGMGIPVNVIPGGTQNVSVTGTNTPVLLASAAASGLSVAKVANLASSTSPTLVKSSAGRVFGYHVVNTGAATRYLRFYNLTAAPTVGTSVPMAVIPLPPNVSVSLVNDIPVLTNTTGISYAITGGAADLDATAITNANEVIGAIFFL